MVNFLSNLADVYGCEIVLNAKIALVEPLYYKEQPLRIYSCIPVKSSTPYEVHVLSVYEVINRRPPQAGDATVSIISREKSDRPIVLVLASHEPVNWILKTEPNITISKVVLVSAYTEHE